MNRQLRTLLLVTFAATGAAACREHHVDLGTNEQGTDRNDAAVSGAIDAAPATDTAVSLQRRDGGTLDALPTEFSMARAIDACVAFTACGGDGMNDCLLEVAHDSAKIDCYLKAGRDCAAHSRCWGIESLKPRGSTPACVGATGTTRCLDSTRLLECLNDGDEVFDCSVYGWSCVTGTSGRARCGQASCGADSRACNGNVLETCEDGVFRGGDCAALGLSCAVVDGEATCTGTGPSCQLGSRRCAGSDVIDCASGKESVVACSRLGSGFSCQEFGTATFCGTGSTCEPVKGTETCSNGTLTVCAYGVSQTIDCRARGYGGCMGGAGGGGYCTP